MNKSLITVAVQTAIISSAMTMSATTFANNAQAVNEISRQAQASSTPVENVQKEETTEKITVTGSRLRRDSFSVATPLAIMSKDGIEDTGLGSLSEILVDELPQISESSSNTNTQSNITATGLSTINLRNLGSSRTLTLIDGRRVVSNSHGSNSVSLSTIPTGMVQRVEVITGGASAAYGSDAIAGVVNIITQQDKEGFEFKARGGESLEGGAKEFSLDFSYGTEFANGRGYIYASSSYDKQYGLTYADRKRAQQQESHFYDDERMCNAMITSAEPKDGQCMRDISPADWRGLNDAIPGGVFHEGSGSVGGFWYDGQTLRDDWVEEQYGIDTDQFVQLKVPDEGLNTAIKIDFELTDDISFYAQVQHSLNKSFNNKAPESEDESDKVITFDATTGEFGEVVMGRISRDNPYVPAEIAAGGGSTIKWDRNFAEVGQIFTDNERNTIRSWAGLQGTVFDGDWDWDVSVGYGRFTQEQLRGNEINTIKAAYALDAEYAEDGVTIQCADEQARANGCLPMNLFGEGSITPEVADYIRANPTIDTTVEQLTITGYMAGDLFEMPAGPVATAFGFEWREDSQDVKTGGGATEGGITFNYVPQYSGEVTVKEVFAEAAFPLLKNVAGAKSLTAEVSARFADYSWSGTDLVESYKTGLVWEIVEGYAIRANWARAQRAPSIDDLLSPPAGDYDSFTDICYGTTATSTDEGHDNCRKEPSIAAAILVDGEFDESDNNYSPSVGNENLIEESADTFTLGVTLAPAFAEGLRIAVDYYDIAIEDALSSYSNEDIMRYCYDSSLAWDEKNGSNSFCNDLKRDEDGALIEIMQRNYNVDEISTSGVDFALEYAYDLNENGRIKFKTDWTHVIDWEKTVQSPDGLETTDYVGYYNEDIFDTQGSASLTWYKDAWRVRWSTKYKAAITVDKDDKESWLDDMAANDENCAAGSADCIENPEALAFNEIASYVKHSISVSYTMDTDSGAEVRLSGGINNIFNNQGSFSLSGRGHYYSGYGSSVGRFAYLGAEVKF
ncbi:TonB-dependent receptor domain-containing protein [Thalassotalea castellviae]|uniref:TonB-dependent receptor n=1 Tax=Thalassotalea castellviae TaxID=3075612 RepID=A0ABU3A3Y8_9GAMM|nr:TonB-dependent receptor [Thalassotalea sp. W431]MDT0604620.1 TonB-dependent receptor [Thalassotalea sp. W431]